MKPRYTAYLYLLLVSLMWGAAGPIIKFTEQEFPPFIFLLYRFFISALLALAILSRQKSASRQINRHFGSLFLCSFFAFTLSLGLLFLGFAKTSALMGQLLSATGPILTAVAGAIFLKERVIGQEKIGITIAFAGTIFTAIQPILNGNGKALVSIEGNLLIVGSVLASIIATIITKQLLRAKLSPLFIANVTFILAFFTMIPVTLTFHRTSEIWEVITTASLASHLGVWYMAVLSGTMAYALYNLAMKSIEIGEASIFAYLYPLWAVPLAVWWLGETVTPQFLLGAFIIAIGVTIAEYRRRQAKSRKTHRHRRA